MMMPRMKAAWYHRLDIVGSIDCDEDGFVGVVASVVLPPLPYLMLLVGRAASPEAFGEQSQYYRRERGFY